MKLKAWHLAALEDYGYGTTNTALINRVARYLAKNKLDIIEREEFERACVACGVDPYSFTQDDFNELQRKLIQVS